MQTRKRTFGTRTQIATFMADFGSIVSFNPNNFNSLSFSFVLDETLQLEETPIANPIIHSLSSSNVSYSFKIFHYNLATIKTINNLFADVMINPSHETPFFSRNLFQEPSGTSSAFALEFTSQEFEFPFNLFDLGGVKELPIRSDSEIIYSEVNAKNSMQIRAFDINLFGECEQKETFAFGINLQQTFSNFPTEIGFVTIWNSKRNFNPSFDCRNTQYVLLERERTRSIISNRAVFDSRLSFGFFDNPTSLFDTRNSKLGWQSYFSQRSINKGMQFNIIPNFQFPSLIDTDLHTSFIGGNSINYLLPWFNLNFTSCSDLHNFSNNSNYLNLTEGSISPPTPKGAGIRNARFI